MLEAVSYGILDFINTHNGIFKAVEMDSGTRFLQLNLFANGTPLDLSNSKVFIECKNSDDTEIKNECVVLDQATALIRAELTSQMLVNPKLCSGLSFQISVVEFRGAGDSGVLTSPPFGVRIYPKIVQGDAIVAENETTIVDSLVNVTQGLDTVITNVGNATDCDSTGNPPVSMFCALNQIIEKENSSAFVLNQINNAVGGTDPWKTKTFYYNNGDSQMFTPPSTLIRITACGGGGGGHIGSGGGGGALVYQQTFVIPENEELTISVGRGGIATEPAENGTATVVMGSTAGPLLVLSGGGGGITDGTLGGQAGNFNAGAGGYLVDGSTVLSGENSIISGGGGGSIMSPGGGASLGGGGGAGSRDTGGTGTSHAPIPGVGGFSIIQPGQHGSYGRGGRGGYGGGGGGGGGGNGGNGIVIIEW